VGGGILSTNGKGAKQGQLPSAFKNDDGGFRGFLPGGGGSEHLVAFRVRFRRNGLVGLGDGGRRKGNF